VLKWTMHDLFPSLFTFCNHLYCCLLGWNV
jgi:hypothetical protein